MADSAADSTKTEEDTGETVESGVSSSHTEENNSNSSSASEQINKQNYDGSHVGSSTDTQNTKTSAPGFWGAYPNPFLPRAPLKTDVVSIDSSASESNSGLIAPSKFNASASNTDTESTEKRSYLKPSILAAPKLSGMGNRYEPVSSPYSPSNSFHIRRSVFSGGADSNKSSSILKPAKLPDPTKSDGRADSVDESEASTTEKPVIAAVSNERLGGASADSGTGEVSSSSVSQTSQGDAATDAEAVSYNHNIVPDIRKINKLKDSSGVSSSSQSDFVFGRNLSQRVTGVDSPGEAGSKAPAASGFVFGESLSSRVVADTNGASQSPHKDDGSDSDSGKQNQTLEESAREYQAKHDNKTELKEVERITGEEEESNVLQANAKLYLFDAGTQTWVERGRGIIRLNDMSTEDHRSFQSRLVMRTQGSLRVVLNTKIWPGMTVERASHKSVRITAMDTDESIRVFLIMTNTKDSENVLRAIDWRIQQLKIQEEPNRTEARVGDKRKASEADFESPNKKKTSSPTEHVTSGVKKEESDSSVQDPETEASCESHSSSFTIKSESD